MEPEPVEDGVLNPTRRGLLAGAAALGAALPFAGADAASAAHRRRTRRRRPPPAAPAPGLGRGAHPSGPARRDRAGESATGRTCSSPTWRPSTRTSRSSSRSPARQGWVIRPALKSFNTPGLAAYVLGRLPVPRGLVFHLRSVDELLATAPAGTDLLQAYPPALPELARYLSTPGPPPARRQRVRLLVDSLELLGEVAKLAPRSKRPLPLDVVLQLEGGLELSGLRTPEELTAALAILREHASALRFSGWLAYDGHGTFRPDRTYRQQVADDARRRQAKWNAQLRAEAADLIAAPDFVRTAPRRRPTGATRATARSTRSRPAWRSCRTATSRRRASTTRASCRCSTTRPACTASRSPTSR